MQLLIFFFLNSTEFVCYLLVLSTSGSLNIIPFTKSKVKRFFQIFFNFFYFLHFFYFVYASRNFFKKKTFSAIYIFIICRARTRDKVKRRASITCNRRTFYNSPSIFSSFYPQRNTFPPNNRVWSFRHTQDISLRPYTRLQARQSVCRIVRICIVIKASFISP